MSRQQTQVVARILLTIAAAVAVMPIVVVIGFLLVQWPSGQSAGNF